MDFPESIPGEYWSIRVENCYKAFGSNKVMNGLNLSIPEGMITVVLGPSGTGKSVLIKHLIGLMFPDAGDVKVHGESVPKMPMHKLLELRKKFGILFQDGALFGSMNVYDNVAFPLRQHTDKSEPEIREIVERRLEDVGLQGAHTRTPGELSGGMKKRAGFARALVLEPEIVMFDEPDSGLDPVRTALLCDLIKQIQQKYKSTGVVISHDIKSCFNIGDHIILLHGGKVVDQGSKEELQQSRNPFTQQFIKGAIDGPLGME